MNTTARYVITVGAVGALILGVGFAANALSSPNGPAGAPVGVAVTIPGSPHAEASAHASPEVSTTPHAEPPAESSTEPAEHPHLVQVTPSPSVVDLGATTRVSGSSDETDHESDHTTQPTEDHSEPSSDSSNPESSTEH
jgi:hypothetical protein